MDTIWAVVIFVLFLFTLELLYYGFATVRNSETRQIRKRLENIKSGNADAQSIDILRRRKLSDIPWLNRLLQKIRIIHKLDSLLIQANVNIPVALLLLSSFALMAAGYLVGSLLSSEGLVALLLAGILGYLPFLYVHMKKAQRMSRFQRQLPDALELVARTMRAGHAFSGGLKMASEEFDDPIGTEFHRTLDEINFGVSVPDALKNMAQRVDCPDLKYFVISVIIQRETGGNLAEIIDSIGRVIRERFKFEGRVRALTAEGRMSAIVLFALPIFLTGIIHFLNPDFIGTLKSDPIGRGLAVWAMIMMIFGAIVTRKMVRIRV